MKVIKGFLMILAVLVTGTAGMAQTGDSTRIVPFHISFITPLGTNGLQSWNTTNRISLNLFAGYSGGLKGIEFAGFGNVLKGDMDGIQLAGFCNNTFGRANGIELAGFWNYNQMKLKGLQLSGFANAAMDTVEGIQASGFANITVGDMSGIQSAGFANITTGTQMGLQSAGFFNYAQKLHGVQIGFVNVADTVEKGIPIGFLSLVKHGYKVIQIGGNETLYGEISFKTGVRQFYNIFSLGASVKNESVKWGFGYGIGTLIPLGRRLDMSIEGISYQLNEDAWYSYRMNMLNRLNLSLTCNITRSIGIYAGGSWNVLVTGNEIEGDLYHHWRSDVSMYPGFCAGVKVGL